MQLLTCRAAVQANAHEQLGQLLPREKHKHAYDDALKERFKHLPEIKRILRHRHLPTNIYKVRAAHPVLPRCCAPRLPSHVARSPARRACRMKGIVPATAVLHPPTRSVTPAGRPLPAHPPDRLSVGSVLRRRERMCRVRLRVFLGCTATGVGRSVYQSCLSARGLHTLQGR